MSSIGQMYIFFITLVLISISFDVGEALKNKKQAFISIGPWTPATISLGDFLTTNGNTLEKAGYQFDITHPSEKTAEDYHDYLLSTIQQSGKANQNIFIHSEILQQFSEDQVLELQSGLAAAQFDAVVIFAYQEILNHIMGSYAEQLDYLFLPNFTTYLLQQSTQDAQFYQVELFAKVFGKQHTHVIDLYGMATAQQDFSHVVFCEIMSVLCDTSVLNKNGASALLAYSPPPFTYAPLMFLTVSYATAEDCTVSSAQISNIRKRLEDAFTDLLPSAGLKAPTQCLNLEPVVVGVEQLESGFYFNSTIPDGGAGAADAGSKSASSGGDGGMRWHYRNAEANTLMRNKVPCFEELQVWEMEEDPKWQEWLRDQVASMRKGGDIFFSNC